MVWYRYWADPGAETPESATPPETEDVAVSEDDVTAARTLERGGADSGRAFHVEPFPGSTADVGEGSAKATAPDRESTFHVEHDRTEQAPTAPSGATAEPTGDAPIGGQVVVVANQKGGVGKTTTAVSVAAALAQQHHRVLLVDLDPQGNATSGLGLRADPGEPTTYHVLVEDADIHRAIIRTEIADLQLVPSSIDLAGAEIELVSAFSREQKLRRALKGVRASYDVIIVDCPPSLGLLTVNALTAGDAVLVPIQCEYYALEGLGSLQQNIELIKLHLNPALRVAGYVMTMHDGRTRLSEQVVEEVRGHFGDKVFPTRVPRSVRLAEAPSYGQPITVFDPASRGSIAYHRVARELVARLVVDSSPGSEPPPRSGRRHSST